MTKIEEKTKITPLKVINGIDTRIMLYPDRLVIQRGGWVSRLVASLLPSHPLEEETIYLDQLIDIQIREYRFLTNGYLEFTVGKEDETKVGFIYAAKNNRAVREIRDTIQDVISKNQPFPDFEAV
jgi:hypothetical protein